MILDASRSKDDLSSDQLSYHWEEVKGPVRSDFTSDSVSLELSDLKEGDYQFKLVALKSKLGSYTVIEVKDMQSK